MRKLLFLLFISIGSTLLFPGIGMGQKRKNCDEFPCPLTKDWLLKAQIPPLPDKLMGSCREALQAKIDDWREIDIGNGDTYLFSLACSMYNSYELVNINKPCNCNPGVLSDWGPACCRANHYRKKTEDWDKFVRDMESRKTMRAGILEKMLADCQGKQAAKNNASTNTSNGSGVLPTMTFGSPNQANKQAEDARRAEAARVDESLRKEAQRNQAIAEANRQIGRAHV